MASEGGCGTTFKMLLPPAVETAGSATPPSNSDDTAWRGSGVVLLVDDEEIVRNVAGQILRVLGFEVVPACDGREGLARFAENPKRFALVLLDLTMPHLDGAQTFAEIRKADPTARVVLMSGFNEPEASAGFTGEGLAGFLQKPFNMRTFQRTLRTALA